jgi:hypothetical protein
MDYAVSLWSDSFEGRSIRDLSEPAGTPSTPAVYTTEPS